MSPCPPPLSFVPVVADFDCSILQQSTLILPTVSTGNIPQLLADLIVSSTKPSFRRLGYLNSPYVLNFIGPDAFNTPHQLAMPIEVYHSSSYNITLLQLRSSVILGFGKKFSQSIWTWAIEAGISQVLTLASADAAYRTDTLMECTPSFRHICINQAQSPNQPTSLSFPDSCKPLETQFTLGKLPGSGILASMISVATTFPIPTLILLVFNMEGDNLADVFAAWNVLTSTLGWVDRKLVPLPPSSWSTLFDVSIAPNVSLEMY